MKKIALYTLAFISLYTSAFDEFLITDIRIIGLQRVSIGSIFTAIPVSVGDKMSQAKAREISKALFATAQFNDIQIAKDGNALIISLLERPSISSIELEGNKALKSEDLLKGLEGAGIAEGQVYKRSTLNGMKSELVRQYSSQGRYGASVNIETEDRPRNTLALKIIIDEGKSAKIKKVNIIGNNLFTDEELMTGFELQEGKWYAFLSNKDKYSKEKLEGDIENLESFYLDRGYLKFSIESSQVSVSKNKEDVFITLSISEGDQYKIDDVSVIGEMPLDEAIYNPIVESQKNKIYSQAQITQIEEYFVNLLGNEGYTFAEVSGNPEINQENKTVSLLFLVQPGNRTYARKILFAGNYLTNDEVLRREMRQMEGGSANNALIELSKVRLERLGYFKEVGVENIPVAGTDDQIDVVYTVEEQPSGSVGASLGFAQGTGLILGANLNENNFLGTGKQVGVGVNRSRYQTSLSFNYNEPYFTVDGVGVGYSFFGRETNYDEINIASFSTNSFGANVNWSYPVSEIERIGFGFGYENLALKTGSYASTEIQNFVDENGTDFDTVNFNVNWVRSTLNRGVFATRGTSHRAGVDLSVPGSGLEYYKFTYAGQYLRGLTRSLTLKIRADLGYGDSYGGTTQLPFFKNFYGGGFGSVRGFKRNTLGPQDNPSEMSIYYDDPDPIGGNVQVEFGAEIIFPLPFIKDQRSVQPSLFFDVGNIFNSKCAVYDDGSVQKNCFKPSIDELRYSIGVGATWLSGFGPITFSIAKPFNKSIYDETEVFQFSLGNQF